MSNLTPQELFDSSAAPSAAPKSVNLGNRKRVKSVYRDARFRPLFQALAELQSARATGGTSVIYSTPSHPHYPILSLNPSALPVLKTLPPFPLTAEPLTEDELHADARHWRQFNASTPRSHRLPAEFRDLSDEYRLEWFHHALRLSGGVASFSVQLDDTTADLLASQSSAARWMQKRLFRRLKQALGFVPAFWFVIEISDRRRLHIHGEISNQDQSLLPLIRKAFRLACGEWKEVRQHQAHTHAGPDVWWTNYASKDSWRMKRPRKLAPAYLSRPISGSWYAASDELRASSLVLYTECQRQVATILNSL